MSVQARIESKLAMLDPLMVEVVNESHMHSVPANSETHFKVTLVSERFDGLMPVKRRQLLYALLDESSPAPSTRWRCICIPRSNGRRAAVRFPNPPTAWAVASTDHDL